MIEGWAERYFMEQEAIDKMAKEHDAVTRGQSALVTKLAARLPPGGDPKVAAVVRYRSPIPLSPRPESRKWALNPPHPVNEIFYQRTVARLAKEIERERGYAIR
jgi:hypothetical protein